MARTVLERQLTSAGPSQVRFVLAGPGDDAAIRRLLRESAMEGEIRLSFEREPDYFQSTAIAGAEDQTILAFEPGRLVCLGRCSLRQRYWNGQLRPVAYLSELRLAASAQGRFDILRRGYRFFRALHSEEPVYFTSIAADNQRSIRFLERSLPGMPTYQREADFVTLFIPVPRGGHALRRLESQAEKRLAAEGLKSVAGSTERVEEMAACLNGCAEGYQGSVAWTPETLRSLERWGLPPADFQLLGRGTQLIACAALWDQRSWRQTVIRGYGPRMSFSRPWINLASGFFGTPRLPSVGSTLAMAFLSPMAVPRGQDQLLLALIEGALPRAAHRGIELLTLGFDASDPRLATLRGSFRCREYLSRLYCLRWGGSFEKYRGLPAVGRQVSGEDPSGGCGGLLPYSDTLERGHRTGGAGPDSEAVRPDGRVFFPEVALL
jgi:hypothetical protein